jgi:hypothetical protein
MSNTRQPRGIPAGGQFAAARHGEAGLALASVAAPVPGLEHYGNIPAPLEGQTLVDGSPAASTFQESYRQFFRPLEEYEAEHGEFRPAGDITEAGLLDLAGLKGVDLGRFKGASFERDEATGEAVVIVHTRNGGYNAYCYEDDCAGDCPGCIQSDAIPNLPTFIRAEHESGDTSNYFRASDHQAGEDLVAEEERRRMLHHRQWLRRAIAEGRQPPWAVLSPVLGEDQRKALYRKQLEAQDSEARHRPRRQQAAATLEAIQTGAAIPYGQSLRPLPETSQYNVAVMDLARNDAQAKEAREGADALKAELANALPPTIKALATREHERLEGEAADYEKRAAANLAKVHDKGAAIKQRMEEVIRDADAAEAASNAAVEQLKDFDWLEAWPGNPADAPPRPATAG